MTYIDYETGPSSARPIELYEFDGTFNDYYLTSYGVNVTSLGREFVAFPISRNGISVNAQDTNDRALEITLPFDHPIVQEYGYQNAPPRLTFRLYRCHEQDPDERRKLWEGPITNFTVEGKVAKLVSPSSFGYLLAGNTPVPRFQAPCNHVLYDSRCGVDPALHQMVVNILNVNNNDITISSTIFANDEAAAGIMISPTGESRMIISNIGTAVRVSYPFSNLQIGQTVTIRKGCDHSLNGDCLNKFNNVARFGGFPLVPDRNPFTSSID